ncbi:cytochrome P450 2J6-like [Branchiostoma floridae]|uniref:Cytochrome P450 2U1 n=1 Tax=Branchiostoma floridae TaxID=7739 RepID=A0A9J7N5D9_BRAFL|nr:cytochrome P450 2J6-like [Branchiostoma floridae]
MSSRLMPPGSLKAIKATQPQLYIFIGHNYSREKGNSPRRENYTQLTMFLAFAMNVVKVVAGVLDISTVLVLLVSFLATAVLLGRLKRPRLPPGPRAWPVIGNLPSLTKQPHLKFTEWRQQYGDVYTVRMGSDDVVIVNGWEAVREALVKQADEFADRPRLFVFDRIGHGGKGVIFGHYNSAWKANRKFLTTTLRDFGLGKKSMELRIQEEANELCNWLASYNGRPIETGNLLSNAASNIICSVVFGSRFAYDDQDFRRMLDLLERGTRLSMVGQIFNFFPWARFVPFLSRLGNEVMDNCDKIDDFLKKIVQKHQDSFDPEVKRDVIDAYLHQMWRGMDLNSNDLAGNFSEECLVALIFDLFIAGTDTSMNTQRWALLYLATHPDIQREVQEEVDRVVGRDAPVSLAHRPEMPYTDAFLHEVLRIRPPGPLSVPHMAGPGATLNGYEIPQNTQVYANLWSLHMDPEYWPEPERFDPARFIGPDGKVLTNPPSYAPFSLGRRACPGKQLAKSEAFLFLVTMVQRFSFKLPEGAPVPPMDGVMGFSLAAQPHSLCAISRN